MANDSTEDLLAQVPLFKGLPKKDLDRVASLTTRVEVPAGTVLAKEGTEGYEFLIILSGEIEVIRGGDVISMTGPGGYVGEIALLEHRPRTATLVTKTECVLEVINRLEFATLLEDEPEIGTQIKATAAERIAELDKLAKG
jgi:CRP/FNR family transcriptional regulator, cyclic AMP receptor protein